MSENILKFFRCDYNDCGWCYAPEDNQNNSRNSECHNPNECHEKKRQVEIKIKTEQKLC